MNTKHTNAGFARVVAFASTVVALGLLGCSSAESNVVAADEAKLTSSSTLEQFCEGKTADLPTLHCKKGGDGALDELVQCVGGGQSGLPTDPPDSARSIYCLMGCETLHGFARCHEETEEVAFCRGKTGDIPSTYCMRASGGGLDKVVQCVPGGQSGRPTDAPDSATSILCLTGCDDSGAPRCK